MLIGVDASHLNPSNMSGMQVYLYSLLHNISSIDDVNTYYVYTKHPVSSDYFSQMTNNKPNFHCKIKYNSLSWTQVALAKSTFFDQLDVLLCPWQTVPILHRPATKIVSVIHGLEYGFLGFGPTFYSTVFSSSVICVSEFTKKSLLKYLPFLDKKMHVVYEGIDTKKFHKSSDEEINSAVEKYAIRRPYMFFVGYMVPRKNIARLIQAYAKYVSRVKNPADLVLGGNIPKKNRNIVHLTQQLGISDRVRFIGYVGDRDLSALISGAELLAYVSLSEGFGLPPLEAMACSTPVLTSTTGALPEVCADAALLVDPYNVADISSSMEKLLLDYSLRSSLIDRGLENVKRFNWHSTARKVLDILVAQRS